jgi:hypothetical protein
MKRLFLVSKFAFTFNSYRYALEETKAECRRLLEVGRYTLNSVVDPQLESARFQPLSRSSDVLVSKFAFKFTACTATSRRTASWRSSTW